MTLTEKHSAALAAGTVLALLLLARIFAQPPGVLIFSADGSGRGQGAILHPGTTQMVDETHPAKAGDAVELYLAGPYAELKKCPAGAACEAAAVAVSIGGFPAQVIFSGRPAGAKNRLQVNVRIPESVEPGSAVPVLVQAWRQQSNEVTLAVR